MVHNVKSPKFKLQYMYTPPNEQIMISIHVPLRALCARLTIQNCPLYTARHELGRVHIYKPIMHDTFLIVITSLNLTRLVRSS